MADVPSVIVNSLSPYVGAMVADTCVRATALSLGKTRDTLTSEDLPALETNIQRLLGPIAPSETIERVLAEIRGGVA